MTYAYSLWPTMQAECPFCRRARPIWYIETDNLGVMECKRCGVTVRAW